MAAGEGVLGPVLDPRLEGVRGNAENRLTREALRPFGLFGGGLGVALSRSCNGGVGGMSADRRLLTSDSGVDPREGSGLMLIELPFG